MKKDHELLEAARTGNLLLIEKLLSPPKSGTRSLAASLGIKLGANVNCQDQSGYTPLHHAALNGHQAVVKYLLQNSASVNISDSKGSFPLHLAAWSGNYDIASILLTHGPSVAKVNEKNGDKETALHCAAQHGHSKTVEVLLNNGADPSVRNIRQESPLDLASQYGRLDVVRLLLHHQPSLLKRFPDCFSPLHLASRNGHKEVVELLLAHGADVNRNGENGTPLHEAALFGKLDVVKLLLTRGANPHALDPKNRSPLELVNQLNTQTSREIGKLILSRLQEGDDYEPISSVANPSLTPTSLRCFLQEPSYLNASHSRVDPGKAFIEGEVHPASSNDHEEVPEVTVEEHIIAPPDVLPTASFPVSRSHTFRGFGGSWSRSTGIKHGFSLRRTASTRSSKSLPRLPSSRSRSPASSSASPDLRSRYRQHHPSSNMFPVSPKYSRKAGPLRRSSSSLPCTSLSLMSLPVLSSSKQAEEKESLKSSLKTDDDSVFLNETTRGNKVSQSSGLTSNSHALFRGRVANKETIPQPKNSTNAIEVKEQDTNSTSLPSPSSRPVKPARQKLSTITSPPPIPPKPANMTQGVKDRPPSPACPPPFDEDFDFVDDVNEDQPDINELRTSTSIGADGTSEPKRFNAGDKIPSSSSPSTLQVMGTASTARDQSSVIRSPSPQFSPPSPHSAMIEVSKTLQNALSVESSLDVPDVEESLMSSNGSIELSDRSNQSTEELSKADTSTSQHVTLTSSYNAFSTALSNNYIDSTHTKSHMQGISQDQTFNSSQIPDDQVKHTKTTTGNFPPSTHSQPLSQSRQDAPSDSTRTSKVGVDATPSVSVATPTPTVRICKASTRPTTTNVTVTPQTKPRANAVLNSRIKLTSILPTFPSTIPSANVTSIAPTSSTTVSTATVGGVFTSDSNIYDNIALHMRATVTSESTSTTCVTTTLSSTIVASTVATNTIVSPAAKSSPTDIPKIKTDQTIASNPKPTSAGLLRSNSSRVSAPDHGKAKKPPVPSKPVVKPRPAPKPQFVRSATSSSRKDVKPPRPVQTESQQDEQIRDSTKCYVTGTAEIKRARILSTRSNDSNMGNHSVDPELTPKVLSPGAFFNGFESNQVAECNITQSTSIGVTSPSMHDVKVFSNATSPTGGDELDEVTPVNEPSQFEYDVPVTQPKRNFNKVAPAVEELKETSTFSTSGSDASIPMETRSNSDWNDSLSDRTEDFEMPKEVRKFRGLIRGASYRARSGSRYNPSRGNQEPYDDSHREVDFSDGYGVESDEDDLTVRPIGPVVLPNNVVSAKLAVAKSMTRETATKLSDAETLTAIPYPTGMKSRRQPRKHRSSRRSDGGDSPLSSSSAEEYDKTTRSAQNKTSLGPELDFPATFDDQVRTNSFYDNNNNSSNKMKLEKSKSSDSDSTGRLPDLDSIKDTVAAVRSRSQTASKSESESSASSTLAKSALPPPSQEEHSDEWAQIANIMSSIGGGLNKGPVYAKEFEETFWKIMTGSDLPRHISTWLSELGLPQYEKVLMGNGFDDVDFLADVLEEQDLVDMAITDASHRRRILESAKNLPKLETLPPADSPKAPSSVSQWLSSLHLSECETTFKSSGCNTMSQVRALTEKTINPLVSNRGHLKRIIASLRLNEKPSTNRSTRKSSSSQAKSSPPLSRSPMLETADFFKDYNTIVNSRTASASTSSDTSVSVFQSGTVSSTSSSNTGSSSNHSAEDKALNSRRIPSDIPETTEPIIPPTSPSNSSSHRHRSVGSSQTHDQLPGNERRSSASSSKRSRPHRQRSSREGESKAVKHRSRSSSSSRQRRSELSVFVEGNRIKQDFKRSESRGRRSRASSSRRGSEEKENRKMSGNDPVTNVPDTQRATFLASESDGSGLNLRPPNQTTEEVTVSAWRHPPEILITSCCNYQAYYLGSMLVPELKGVESTMEACAKMKKSTDSMKKIPTITLSINYKGVKFIDFKSKHEIAEHEIQNISFASQDSEDLSTFAYITHDVRTRHHYCHVFRVTTMDMAYEVILTLGQAFEVAYQLILKDKALKETKST